jgi:L-cysteine desulfidase
MHGIEPAVVLGAIGGDASKEMEVLEAATKEHIANTNQLLEKGACRVDFLDSEIPLHFQIEMHAGDENVVVEVKYSHLNVTRIEKNGEVVLTDNHMQEMLSKTPADRSALSLEQIKAFADEVDVREIKDLFEQQIRCNMDIAYEGISGDYGLGIGRVIRSAYADSTITRMKAYAAAASEARMAGCNMPVIINSGSGNQGIASSVPVIVYARENNVRQETLYRSLAFAGLLTIFQKEFIGKLSAFCGAVSASCAAGAAITYMKGGSIKQIRDTIDNTLANIPGIICDGAKISCAAKIASSVDAAMMAHHLAMEGQAYEAYTGILREEVEETISCVGYIGKIGMRETDKEIVKLMLEK